MKKLFTLLSLIAICFVFVGCGDPVEPPTPGPILETYYEPTSFSFTFDDGAGVNGSGELTVDYTKFLTNEFNADSAKFGVLLDMERAGISITFTDDTSCFNVFGLKHKKIYTMNHIDYDNDENDLSNLIMGTTTFFTKDNVNYQLYVCVIDPYVDNTGWTSNFDIGADTDAFYSLTGEHPEWTNKLYHKGFSVAANRIKAFVMDYVSKYQEEDTVPVFYITGQSRGGAIGNILAKELTDSNYKTVAYLFNTPNTTTEPVEAERTKYTNIYNILNEDDFISSVPLEAWGFHRYGIDLSYTMSSHTDEYKTFYNSIYKSLPSDVTDGLKDFLKSLSETRESAYEFCSMEDALEYNTYESDTYDDCLDLINEIMDMLPDVELIRNSVTYEISETEDGFLLVFRSAPSLIIYSVGELIDSFNLSMDMFQILLVLEPYISLMPNYLEPAIDSIVPIFEYNDFQERLTLPHVVYTDLLGIDLIEK